MFVRVYGYRVMYGLEQEGESGYGPTIFQWFPAQFGYHGRNTAGPSWIFADKSGRSALYSFQPVFVVLFRPKKKKVALSRPTVKCEKTGSGFLFIFF